ncbi:MAG TPA: MarR family winged helix-turn-helix transcriptional regulator, partial [Devosia sp.]|nr:MarR family winged helix-turn-helix transcriptional regulator [Devosia sp.]
MARLFHEVAGQGLRPLGIRPEQFPVLIELWFGERVSRQSLAFSQEMDLGEIDRLLATMAADGLIAHVPANTDESIVLTEKASDAREGALVAARRANAAAASALDEDELAQFIAMMNRVIDALK